MKRAAALLRAQRSLSPDGHRSSSLPPPEHRNKPSTTPSTSSRSKVTLTRLYRVFTSSNTLHSDVDSFIILYLIAL